MESWCWTWLRCLVPFQTRSPRSRVERTQEMSHVYHVVPSARQESINRMAAVSSSRQYIERSEQQPSTSRALPAAPTAAIQHPVVQTVAAQALPVVPDRRAVQQPTSTLTHRPVPTPTVNVQNPAPREATIQSSASTFTNRQVLATVEPAGRDKKKKERKKKKAKPNHPAPSPPVNTRGQWKLYQEFDGRKSFGSFMCTSCRKQWISAHAYLDYRQACKNCDEYYYATWMWKNYDNSTCDGIDIKDTKNYTGPHDRERCEACAVGVCSLARGSSYSYSDSEYSD